MIFTVPNEFDGICVKNFLRRYCNVSARLLTKLKIEPDGITANGKHIRSIDILHGGDIVRLKLPEENNNILPVNLHIDVLYEDSNVIVYNKPPFMPVHPVHEHQSDTLANAAAYYAEKNGEKYNFHAINRLDRDTSGIVLCAKDRYSAAFLPEHTEKLYFALCEGKLIGKGTINEPIRLKEGNNIQREIGNGGLNSVTHWRTIEYFFGHSLLECKLETGRTHQIRVHMSGIGYPLAGDDMYGGSRKYFSCQCLHCGKIEFIQPVSKEKICISSKEKIFEWKNTLYSYFVENS